MSLQLLHGGDLVASCGACGKERIFAKGTNVNVSSLNCECGGRLHKGRYYGRPSPVEVHGLLLSLLDAEREESEARQQYGTGSVLWEEANLRLGKARIEWDKARQLLATS